MCLGLWILFLVVFVHTIYGGTRIKTRKRNIAAPLDPAAFADAVVQIYLDNAGAVGTSLVLETIIQHCSAEIKSFRNYATSIVLVCSRGGGGLLKERMELVAEQWEEKIKAEFVPTSDPSLTEQYEYANERDIRCLVIITEMSVSEKGSVQVRHLELKRAKKVDRENLVKFLSDALASQFRNPSMWT